MVNLFRSQFLILFKISLFTYKVKLTIDIK